MRRQATIFLVTMLVAGCSALQRTGQPTPEERLELGLLELRRGEYEAAVGVLSQLAMQHPGTEEGRQALVVLAAAQLDPRNPQRSLNRGATRAAQVLLVEDLQPWQRPLGETLYLLALELGARPDTLIGRAPEVAADMEQARVVPLPALPVATVPARLAEVTEQRKQSQQRVAALEAELAERARELSTVREELERIRRTIRP